jgi:sulfur carrier protein
MINCSSNQFIFLIFGVIDNCPASAGVIIYNLFIYNILYYKYKKATNKIIFMQITINNEFYTFDDNIFLEKVIDSLQLDETKGIAIALNETIIHRNKWNETAINNGDKIIIIGAVAGG